MNEILEKLINTAVLAPSGDNCQPWRFEANPERLQIKIFNLPERDTSVYNNGQTASYIAHGALAENLHIAAGQSGFEASLNFFPDPSATDLVCRFQLGKILAPRLDPLYPAIFKRCSNRKPYGNKPLTPEQQKQLLECTSDLAGTSIKIVTEKRQIEAVAKAASANEKILFSNPYMHDFFFNHISWTKQEDEKKSLGFFIDTLELPPPAKLMFKLAKSWKKLAFLNRLGFSRLVAAANQKNFSACSALAAVTFKGSANIDTVTAGRALQRLWLTLTSMGLNAQPMSGILFLKRSIDAAGETRTKFSSDQIREINLSSECFSDTFGVPVNNIAMVLRIGSGPGPSAKSSRLKPEIKWE